MYINCFRCSAPYFFKRINCLEKIVEKLRVAFAKHGVSVGNKLYYYYYKTHSMFGT